MPRPRRLETIDDVLDTCKTIEELDGVMMVIRDPKMPTKPFTPQTLIRLANMRQKMILEKLEAQRDAEKKR